MSGSDERLLAAWADGDNHAGDDLLSRYFDRLIVFFGPRAEHEAEDLVQRTLLACLRARASVRQASSFRAFVFATARNELVDHYRRRRPEALPPEPDDAICERTTPSEFVLDGQRRRILARALYSLDVELQVVVALHFWEGMTLAEIAEVVGIPIGTVKSRLRRAREALYDRLLAISSPADVESTFESLETWAARLRGDAADDRRE